MVLEDLTIRQASGFLKSGNASSLELTQYYLDRIEKENPKLNAFITITKDLALKQAKEADRRIKAGKKIGELDGIPMAIKDNMAVFGYPTTAGSKILEDFIPPYDAFVVKKLKKAGAVILGKTNMDEFAMGSSTESSYFGPTKNPCDLSRVPGGSSGGSAAAVAADLCIYALGSDTGGSIRQPASFCGVVGLKPTYGAVSRNGLLAMASSLDQIGPITKTVEDAEIVFDVISGYDPDDSTSVKGYKGTERGIKVNKGLKDIKIGVPKEYFIKGIEKEVEKLVKEKIKNLKKLGAKVVEVSLPHTEYALACYYIIMPSEASTNLARYDGIKYGHSIVRRPKSPSASLGTGDVYTLLDVYLKSRAEGFGDEAKRRIMLGTYSLSAGYYDQYYLKAAKVRSLVKADFDKAFHRVDVLVTPTSPTVAFKLGEKLKDPVSMYLSDVFTVPVNIAGMPAISISCKQDSKLPIGLQIIGPQFGDNKILNFAKLIEEEWRRWEERRN